MEIQELINRYKVTDGTGMINYAQFLAKLNEVFSDQMTPSETIAKVKAHAVSARALLNPFVCRCSLMRRRTPC